MRIFTDFSNEELKLFTKEELSSFRKGELDDFHGLLSGVKLATSEDPKVLEAQKIIRSVYEIGGPCEKLDTELANLINKLAERLNVEEATDDEDLNDLRTYIDDIVEAVCRVSYIYSRLIKIKE